MASAFTTMPVKIIGVDRSGGLCKKVKLYVQPFETKSIAILGSQTTALTPPTFLSSLGSFWDSESTH